MRTHLSKEVTDRLRACLFVLSAFVKHGREVAAAVLGIVQPNPQEGEGEPGFSTPLTALSRTLKAAMDRMVTADLKLYAALAAESTLREKRDDLTANLAQQLIGLRQTVNGQYVAPKMDGLGLERLTHRDAMTVLRRGELVAQRFQAENLTRCRARAGSRTLDVRHCLAQVTPVVAELRGVVDELNVGSVGFFLQRL